MASKLKTKLILVCLGVSWFPFFLYLLSSINNNSKNGHSGERPLQDKDGGILNKIGLQKDFQQLSFGGLMNQFSGSMNSAESLKRGKADLQIVIHGDESSMLGVVALINSIQANMHKESKLQFFVTIPKKLISHFSNWIKSSRNLKNLQITTREHIDSQQNEKMKNLSKLYILEIFPEVEGIFVFLNSDALVQGNLLDLVKIMIDDDNLALAPNECHTMYKHSSSEHPYYSSHLNFSHPAIKAQRLNPKSCTFNSGFFVANATKWRKNKVTDSFRHWVNIHEKGSSVVGVEPFADITEAVLLITLYNRVGYLPSTWHIGYLGAKRSSSFSPEFVSKFKVLQWNGIFKPWHRKCPFSNFWHRYYIKDPYKIYKSHSVFSVLPAA